MSFQEAKRRLVMDDLKLDSHNEKELDSLVQTIHVFSEGIGMEFGIEKCAVIAWCKLDFGVCWNWKFPNNLLPTMVGRERQF